MVENRGWGSTGASCGCPRRTDYLENGPDVAGLTDGAEEQSLERSTTCRRTEKEVENRLLAGDTYEESGG
ncbi:MAG: hypothetical protein ACLRTA_03655 [Clostridia bacterium]